jgi:leader peptidase (prepilin peptidase)/N-methyltransferase
MILSLLFFIGEEKYKDFNVIVVCLSFIPGLIFLLVAKVSKEKIGLGDGWLFLIVAGWIGTGDTWTIWAHSLLLSTFFSIVMLVLKKYKLQSQLPFIPFIWLAHLFLWSTNHGS